MEKKDVTAGLKYQVPFGGDSWNESITHLDEGRVGIVYYKEGYRLGIVNIKDGSVLWEQRSYNTFGSAVPFCDEKTLYAPVSFGTQNLAALDRETGGERWRRYLGNGHNAFDVQPVQTASHVATVNINSDKMAVLDKKDGKITGKVKMPHGIVSSFWPLLCSWRDKFVAVAADRKKDQWTVDLYDPAVEGLFVKTLFRFPEKKGDDGKILLQKIVGDSLYFFTEDGLFCKVDLLSGKILEKHCLPDASHSKHGWGYSGHYIHQYNGRLCAVGFFRTEEDDKVHFFVLRYDLESGVFSAVPTTPPPGLDYLQFYKDSAYHLSKKGLEHWDVFGDGSITEIALEQWKADPIDYDTYEKSGESGRQWLIVEDQLLVVVHAKDGEDSGRLLCWEL